MVAERLLLAAVLAAGIAGGIAVGVSVVAVADGDSTTDTVPRVIPYQGVLEIDGGGYNGEVPMTFAIYLA